MTALTVSIATDVTETVIAAARNAPRSLQVRVGPSELGTPCTRRLGYKLLAWPASNPDGDPWPSVIGTAVHAWMAAAYEEENRQLGYQRYLIEHRVHLPFGISGSTDLFDRDTGVNNDWKIVGASRLAAYKREGPGRQYRVQAHLYGLGLQIQGEQVTDVAITFLSRSGRLRDVHVWTEPYQAAVAAEALQRYKQVFAFHVAADPERHPERWAALPTAEAHCTYCPWFLPGSRDLAAGCPGHAPIVPARSAVDELIA